MLGLFGGSKKKEESAKDAEHPTQATTAGSSESSGDMFGGLAVAPKQRRKRGMTTMDEIPPAAEHTASTPTVPAPAALPAAPPQDDSDKPFFAKFHMDANQGVVAEEESPEILKMRKRLERFYEEHNPSKLSQVEQTIKSYAGREAELFEALVNKYGAEPKDPEESKKHDAQSNSTAAEVQPASSAGFEFCAAADPSEGFSSEGAWGTGGPGFNFDSNTTGAFEEVAAPGFQFQATDNTAIGFSFGTAAVTDKATDVTTGFAFGSTEAPIAGGFAFAEVAPAGDDVPPSAEKKTVSSESDQSDDDDAPTQNERHAAEMRDAQGTVLEKKFMIGKIVENFASAVHERRDLVNEYRTVEADIELCIAKEDFTMADSLNMKLEQIGNRIDALDFEEAELFRTIGSSIVSLEHAAKSLGELYIRQRQELLDTKGEEERRIKKYIAETTSRLDTQAEKLAASLDRANRTLHNTEQEVVNIEQRNQKIQDKIHDQTKGLRSQHTELSTEKETLDAEIRELELKLQQKRRLSADKKMQLSEIEEKLKIIMDDFGDTVGEVNRQLREEQAKREAAQSVVDDLTSQEQHLLREQKEFAEERESMLKTIEQNIGKIERYHVIGSELENEVKDEVDNYFNQALLRILKSRAQGRLVLAESPHRTVADDASPLSGLAKLENQLKALDHALQEARSSEATAALRLQDIRKSIPVLEAAKKAAAQSKQFKEAQAKTEEIKRLTEESTQCESEIAAATSSIIKLHGDQTALQASIEKERAASATKVASFMQSYMRALNDSTKEIGNHFVNVLRLDSNELPEEDDLIAALQKLHVELSLEAARIGVSVGGVAADDQTTAPIEPEDDAREEETAPHAQDEEVHTSSVERSEDDIRVEITGLEERLAEAMEAEDFELCDKLQSEIDALQTLIK